MATTLLLDILSRNQAFQAAPSPRFPTTIKNYRRVMLPGFFGRDRDDNVFDREFWGTLVFLCFGLHVDAATVATQGMVSAYENKKMSTETIAILSKAFGQVKELDWTTTESRRLILDAIDLSDAKKSQIRTEARGTRQYVNPRRPTIANPDRVLRSSTRAVAAPIVAVSAVPVVAQNVVPVVLQARAMHSNVTRSIKTATRRTPKTKGTTILDQADQPSTSRIALNPNVALEPPKKQVKNQHGEKTPAKIVTTTSNDPEPKRKRPTNAYRKPPSSLLSATTPPKEAAPEPRRSTPIDLDMAPDFSMDIGEPGPSTSNGTAESRPELLARFKNVLFGQSEASSPVELTSQGQQNDRQRKVIEDGGNQSKTMSNKRMSLQPEHLLKQRAMLMAMQKMPKPIIIEVKEEESDDEDEFKRQTQRSSRRCIVPSKLNAWKNVDRRPSNVWKGLGGE